MQRQLWFQSPRSGKFVSDVMQRAACIIRYAMFQSPRSGKFVSDNGAQVEEVMFIDITFQSPRSGKFVSDATTATSSCSTTTFQSPRSGKFVSDLII